MKFYVNGTLVKTWTDVTEAPPATPQPVPRCIGQQLPKSIYTSAPTGDWAAD